MTSQKTHVIITVLDCRHTKETRVFYDNQVKSKYNRWPNNLVFCTECKKLRKVVRTYNPNGSI